jgi:hypothetical protein
MLGWHSVNVKMKLGGSVVAFQKRLSTTKTDFLVRFAVERFGLRSNSSSKNSTDEKWRWNPQR